MSEDVAPWNWRRLDADGTLATTDNLIDTTTGTVKMRAVFDNRDSSLFPNQFVNARLLQQEKTGVTLLASAAIQRNTNDTYVYLIQPNNTVTVRNIKIGTTEGDQSEITSGLSPGDKVVMTGVDKLQEGSKVFLPVVNRHFPLPDHFKFIARHHNRRSFRKPYSQQVRVFLNDGN